MKLCLIQWWVPLAATRAENLQLFIKQLGDEEAAYRKRVSSW